MSACVCVCVRACVRACVCVCVRIMTDSRSYISSGSRDSRPPQDAGKVGTYQVQSLKPRHEWLPPGESDVAVCVQLQVEMLKHRATVLCLFSKGSEILHSGLETFQPTFALHVCPLVASMSI